jgi:uncharacterized protein
MGKNGKRLEEIKKSCVEHHNFKFSIQNIESSDQNDKDYIGSFTAFASTFNNIFQASLDNINIVDTVIEKNAFANVIRKMEESNTLPKALIQHDYNDTGAIFTNIEENEEGLLVSGKFINTTKGNDLFVEVKTGAISHMSIGFTIEEVLFDAQQNLRIIKNVKELPEISFVTFPANGSARILDVKSNVRLFESQLRKIGFSQKESKTIISKGYRALNHCDNDLHNDDVMSKEIPLKLDKLIQKIEECKK